MVYNGRGIVAVNLVGGVGVKQTSIVYYLSGDTMFIVCCGLSTWHS